MWLLLVSGCMYSVRWENLPNLGPCSVHTISKKINKSGGHQTFDPRPFHMANLGTWWSNQVPEMGCSVLWPWLTNVLSKFGTLGDHSTGTSSVQIKIPIFRATPPFLHISKKSYPIGYKYSFLCRLYTWFSHNILNIHWWAHF